MLTLRNCTLGIEFGSTRIKAVLVDDACKSAAQGDFTWENRLENGVWTYPLDEVWRGVQAAYTALAADVQARYGQPLTTVGCIGISAMMHGYLPFDAAGNLLVPFRTWRNTMTGQAAEALTAALAGYVHWQLTGRKVLGVGDASGMFPIDSATFVYNAAMLEKFNALAAKQGYPVDLASLLPTVLPAGEDAGTLTAEGAKLLDPTGVLQPGVPFCPPEGDAPAWPPRTVWPRAPAMSAQARVFLPWSCWKSRFPRSTRKSTWSRPPTVRRWPWSTATTAPAT